MKIENYSRPVGEPMKIENYSRQVSDMGQGIYSRLLYYPVPSGFNRSTRRRRYQVSVNRNLGFKHRLSRSLSCIPYHEIGIQYCRFSAQVCRVFSSCAPVDPGLFPVGLLSTAFTGTGGIFLLRAVRK